VVIQTRSVEVILEPGRWRAVYTLADAGGRVEIASVCIEPVGARPPGGLTAQTMGALRITDALRAAGVPVRYDFVGDVGLVLGASAEFSFRRGPRRRSGRQPVTDERLLVVAERYDHAVRAGDRHPALTTAKQLGLAHGTARYLINRARRAGFLTSSKHGVALGALTDKARALRATRISTTTKGDPWTASDLLYRAPASTRAGAKSKARSPKKRARSRAKSSTRARTRSGRAGPSRRRASSATRPRARSSTRSAGRGSRSS